MCQKSPDRRKVGDTLTATVEPADAEVTYSWTLNGIVVGATSSYNVPGTVTTGDIIAVTVTDKEGNTASDSVIVSGLTIVSVEPTTASGRVGGVDVGYKYVRIFFSEPLSSLDASEVEIRHTKTKQLYSIESVNLSSSGLFADVILYGSFDGDGTTFLQANEPYVATVTHDGLTDSLEFELPANAADKVVVAVDVDNNKIVTALSGRSNETQNAGDVDTFDLGLSYTDNLGQLIGRTVNYAYNADSEISDFTIQDEVVVIDTVKFFQGSDNATLADDYFKGSDGTKYYLENDNKSTKNATKIIAADDVTAAANAPVVANPGVDLIDGQDYDFAKLILNPNGTIARAVLLQSVPSFLKVASMSDTTALVDSATSLNLDGYTIIDAASSDLVDPENLNEDDNVFYSIASKFAYVYNESVSGELSNVIKGKLDLDDTTYTWSGSKYYDDGSEKYVDLKTDTTANSTAGQDYLNSLDPDEVELQLKMNGNIAYVIGDVVGAVTTTKTRYVMTAAASGAAVGFDTLYKFPVSDGTTSTNLTIDASKLKSYNGKAGKGSATNNTNFKFDYTDDTLADANIVVATTFPQQALVDITIDEDGNVVGLAPVITPVVANQVTNTSNDPDAGVATYGGTVDKDIATVTVTGGDTFKMNESTNVWIFVVKDATAANSVKKMAFSDYSLNTKDLTTGAADVTVYAATDKAAVKDLVIVQNDKDTTAFQTGDTAKVQGFVTDVKSVRKTDGTEVDVLKSITVKLADGTTDTYEGDGSYVVAGFAKNDVVTIEYYKSNETVKNVAKNNETATKAIYPMKDFSNDTLTMTDGFKVIPASDCLIQKKYTEGGTTKYAPISVEEITSSNNGWTVDYWAISTETGVASVANFIVVADNGTTMAMASAAQADIDALTTADVKAANINTSNAAWETATKNTVDAMARVAAILAETTDYSGAWTTIETVSITNEAITAGTDAAQKAGDVLTYKFTIGAEGYSKTFTTTTQYVPADYVYVNDTYTWLQSQIAITTPAATGTKVTYYPGGTFADVNGCTITIGAATESASANLSIGADGTITADAGATTPTITYDIKVTKGTKDRNDDYTITKANGAATYTASLGNGTPAA